MQSPECRGSPSIWPLALLLAASLTGAARAEIPEPAADPTTVPIGYLKQEVKRFIPLSRLTVEPDDLGVAGAEIALKDNNTTGRFTKQAFTLDVERVKVGGDAVAALQKLVESGHRFVLVEAPAETLLRLADWAKGKEVLLFNVRAPEVSLRQEDCRTNVLHTAPDRAMLADALAQYLVWKRWSRWLVVKGVFPEDLEYLEALRRAAKRFGGTIVEEREYKETPGARRSDTGQQQIQLQMPMLTQGAPAHDVVVVADEKEVFGPYLPFRTWEPRPVAGTAGLRAMSWHPGARAMGRDADAESVRALRQALHAAARLSGVGRGAGDRRGGVAHALGGFCPDRCVPSRRPAGARRVQGPEGDVPQMGRSAPSADHRRGAGAARVDVAARRVPAPVCRGRHARHRRAGEQMQIPMKVSRFAAAVAAGVGLVFAGTPTHAYTVYVSNEKGNSLTLIDSETLEVLETVPVGQRPRGIILTKDGSKLLICASDDDTVQVLDVASRKIVGELPSGPDPELLDIHPSGSPVYIANEDDNLLTVIDLADEKVLAEVEVGVEPEGVGTSPDGKTVVVTSETTNMAHFIDAETYEIVDNVLVGTRPRFAEFTADGTKLWVTSEVAGTVSVIDAATRKIVKVIGFEIPGVQPEYIQPVGVRVTRDGSKAFVALGPANRVAVIDGKTLKVEKYLLVGKRVWQLAFTPDETLLFATNGNSNDVSVIDVQSLKVVKSIPVGNAPWGVAISQD